jgi:hypothetical protein
VSHWCIRRAGYRARRSGAASVSAKGSGVFLLLCHSPPENLPLALGPRAGPRPGVPGSQGDVPATPQALHASRHTTTIFSVWAPDMDFGAKVPDGRTGKLRARFLPCRCESANQWLTRFSGGSIPPPPPDFCLMHCYVCRVLTNVNCGATNLKAPVPQRGTPRSGRDSSWTLRSWDIGCVDRAPAAQANRSCFHTGEVKWAPSWAPKPSAAMPPVRAGVASSTSSVAARRIEPRRHGRPGKSRPAAPSRLGGPLGVRGSG